jgi:UDPglucose 6-dehydrogenase
MMNKSKLAVIGCGKLGAPLVACLAHAGHTVIGIDTNQDLIQNLKVNKITWSEPNLAEYLEKYKSQIAFESAYSDSFSEVTTSFIIVPTPSTSSGEYTIDFVLAAIKSIGEKLNQINFDTHTIVIVSTVMPGDTEGRITSTLNESLGKNSERVSICYSPEFIALGSVIKNLQSPDSILIGEPNEKAGSELQELLLSMVVNQPKVLRMTTAEAEIAKIAINSYVTTKISFSNQISEICERVPGTSAENVLRALGADSRIGISYLKQGTSYGGPCFPRDNRAFAKFAKNIGIDLDIAHATDKINDRQQDRLIKALGKVRPTAKNILIVGMSYKKDTDVYEESPALKFINESAHYNYFVFDDHISKIQGNNEVTFVTEEKLKEKSLPIDVAILFVPSDSYEKIPNYLLDGVLLVDFWGNWGEYRNSETKKYVKIGEFIA